MAATPRAADAAEHRALPAGRISVLLALPIGLALSALVAVMVIAFVWPAVNTAPRNVPLALVGPPAAVDQVAGALAQAEPGAFEVVLVADEAAARTAIAERDVIGALVLGQEGVLVLTAPGAGQAPTTLVAQAGQAVATQLALAQGAQGSAAATVEVVVPAGSGDPIGAGFPALVLPVVIASLLIGLAVALGIGGAYARLTALLVAAALAGGWVALLAGGWLGVVAGTWQVAGVVALAVLAVSATVTGAHTVLGRLGVALATPVLLLVGNPLSAAAAAPSMLPDGWASLGQALPPGALVQALRSVSFFDGVAAGFPLLVLAGWAGAGLLLTAVGLLRAERGLSESRPG